MANMGSLLYEAAIQGNVTTLLELLQQDRLAIDRFIVNGFSETPLHVAAILGHLDFVKEILLRKPELAKELDSQQSSPLHLASAKGYLEVIKVLLRVNHGMCLARDRDGMNPLHLAAMKGRVDVLRELVREVPVAARATVGQGESTVLHLCVKYNQLESLKLLVEVLDDYEFVNAKDDYGMTILHLAVADKQIETVKFLVMNGRVEVNAVNTNGFTALDSLTQSHRDVRDFDIAESLRATGALRNVHSMVAHRTEATRRNEQMMPLASSNKPNSQKLPEEWLSRKRDALMVVASLIATMAFQCGLSPPGGIWQDDNNSSTNSHQAGTSIMAYKDSSSYAHFLFFNTTGFIASLSTIMLLMTGLPFNRRFFMWLLTVTLGLAITSMAVTYALSISIFTPKDQEQSQKTVTLVIKYGVIAWSVVLSLLLLLHTIRLIATLFHKLMPKKREYVYCLRN